jgi:predicted transcriptional regulator
MDVLWSQGPSSVREVQQAFPEAERPAYTTVQTTMNRLEAKHALRRVKKVGNAYVFEALISSAAAHCRIIDEVLDLFGGRTQPLIAHLIESRKLTMDDLREAQATLRRIAAQERRK